MSNLPAQHRKRIDSHLLPRMHIHLQPIVPAQPAHTIDVVRMGVCKQNCRKFQPFPIQGVFHYVVIPFSIETRINQHGEAIAPVAPDKIGLFLETVEFELCNCCHRCFYFCRTLFFPQTAQKYETNL